MTTASRLLAYERESDGENQGVSTPAARVYDKLNAELVPLLGVAGVQALMVRSAKLAHVDFSHLDQSLLPEGSLRLREWLETRNAPDAGQTADALFATFFALLVTFIGERLTTELLRKAWPSLTELSLSEARK